MRKFIVIAIFGFLAFAIGSPGVGITIKDQHQPTLEQPWLLTLEQPKPETNVDKFQIVEQAKALAFMVIAFAFVVGTLEVVKRLAQSRAQLRSRLGNTREREPDYSGMTLNATPLVFDDRLHETMYRMQT